MKKREDQSQPFLGTQTAFQAAFPQVTALEVEVWATPVGFGAGERYLYSLANAPGQFTPCPNPACSGGGYDVGSFLAQLIRQRQTEGKARGGCVGAERLGRHGSRHCHYSFQTTAQLEYAAEGTE
jgi:hypothetical protein